MQTRVPLGDDLLIDRADRAITDAIATRSRVRADLDRARQNARLSAALVERLHDWRPVLSLATATWSHGRVIAPSAVGTPLEWHEDPQLEAEWRRVRPTIETPLDLFEAPSPRLQRRL